jgi:hypothetical protein
MTVHNLYFYNCAIDTFRILKFRTPIALFSLFDLPNRQGFIHRASTIWNFAGQKLSVNEFTVT